MPMLRDGEQMVDMLRTNFSISAAAKYSQNSIISFDSSMPNLYYYIRMGKLNLYITQYLTHKNMANFLYTLFIMK